MMTVGYEAEVDRGDAQTVDLSETGIFLGAPNPLPVGTVLQVQLDEASLRVQVRRVVEGGAAPGAQAGMGVRIIEADDHARQVLRRYLGEPERRRVPVRVDGPWPEAVPGPEARGSADGDLDPPEPEETGDPGNPSHSGNPNGSRRGRRRRRRR